MRGGIPAEGVSRWQSLHCQFATAQPVVLDFIQRPYGRRAVSDGFRCVLCVTVRRVPDLTPCN